MLRRVALTVVLLVLAVMTVSCGGNSDADLPPLEGEVTDLAGAFIDHLLNGDYDSATGYFDATMKRVLSAKKLKQTWESLEKQQGAYVGEVEKQVEKVTEKNEGYDVVHVITEFANETIDIKVVFNSAKRISGLWFLPAP